MPIPAQREATVTVQSAATLQTPTGKKENGLLRFMRGRREFFADAKSRLANHRQALGSVAAVSGGNVISSLLGIFGGLLVARFLGPAETGLFRSFTIPLTYLTFLHIGTFDGLYRQIPYYIGKENPEKARALASAAGAWNIAVSILVTAGFTACALWSLWHGDFLSVAGWLSQALLCWSMFYGGYLAATYRTIRQFVQMARIQVVQSIVNFALVFLIPFLGFYGLCVRSAIPSLLGVRLYHRGRPLKVAYRFDRERLKEVVRIGLPFSFWGSLYTSIWTATEGALMLAFGGVTGLGLFAVASVVRDGMNILPQAVNQVVLPRVVEAYARDGSVRRSNARLFWLTVGLSAFMLLAVVCVMFLLDLLVPLAIPKYVDGLPLMKLCLWFVVVQAASLPLQTIFAAGKTWTYGRGVLAGILVFPLSAYLLTPVVGGILAVAGGSLLGRIARTVIVYGEIALMVRREAVHPPGASSR